MKVRQETIRKPKFIYSYAISVLILLLVFFLLTFLLALPQWTLYVSEAENVSHDYINTIADSISEIMDKEEITNDDLNKIKLEAVSYYSQTASKIKIKIEGYGEFDSSKTAVLSYACWSENKDMDTYRSYLLLLAEKNIWNTSIHLKD